jgi:hypothetical protein
MASATGPTADTKLIAPGSEGELISVIAATMTPATIMAGEIGVPVNCAT